MPTDTSPALDAVRSYGAAWNAHDSSACADHFASDGTRVWMVKPFAPSVPTRYDGPAAIAAGIAGLMGAVPDLRVEIGDLHAISGGAVLEWRVVGTHTGDWDVWTAQDEPVDFPGVSIYTLRDGKFAEERMFFDTALMVANWRPPAA